MKRTGEMLQKAREEKGLSLNEIALSLKINSKVLSAIETGDTSKLPAKTFLRGFVQSYANYLKINTDQVMESFSEEMGATRPVTSADLPATTPEGAAQEPESPMAHREEPVFTQIEKRNNTKLFVITGICLVLVTLIFVTARIVDRYQKETITEEVQVASPLPDDSVSDPEPEQMTSTNDEAETEESPAPAAAAAATAVTPPAPTAPATPPRAETPVPPPTAAAATPAPAKPAETKPTPPVATTPPTPAVTPPPAATTPAPKPAGRPLEMIVESLDNVEIEYGSGSGPLRKVQLGPDRVHTIRSREGLRLNISNGGAVNLNLNGRDLGVPGDLGKPVKLSY